jgi:hypothetical protein
MPGSLRLVPCLAVLALSLPACKREGKHSREPSEDTPTTSAASSPTPTPEDVCRRLSEMAMAEIGPIDPAIQAETIASCADELRLDQISRGPESWDGVARCVVAAQTDADLDRCDALYPPPDAGPLGLTGTGTGSGSDGELEKAVCINMVTVFAVELALEAEAAGQPVPQLSEAQIEEAFTECMSVLSDARREAPPDVYATLLGCLGSAETGEQLEACVGE